MAEETPGQQAPEAVGQQAPGGESAQEKPVELGSYVLPDGKLKDGWIDALVPEDFRNIGDYKTITDLPGLMKQLGNRARMAGKQGKGIFVPTEDSTSTEKDMFYEALGRPKTAAEYKMEAPAKLAQYFPKESIDAAKEVIHKIGLNQAQAAALMEYEVTRTEAGLEAQKAAEDQANADGLAEMQKRWGTALPERTQIVQNLLRDYMSPQDKDKVEAAINKNPYIADLLSNIGKKFMEGKAPATDSSRESALTPGEAKAKMDELIAEQAANPTMRMNNPAKNNRMNEEIKRLAAMSVEGK
jgi:hypothetical protein